MARIKRAVNAPIKRRKMMKLAKGYFGAKGKQHRVQQATGSPFPSLRIHRPQAEEAQLSFPADRPYQRRGPHQRHELLQADQRV